MEHTKVGNLDCLKCENKYTSKDDFSRWDDNFETGVCLSCEPNEIYKEVLEEKDTTEKTTKPGYTYIQRIRRLGTAEQNRKLDDQIKKWEDENPTDKVQSNMNLKDSMHFLMSTRKREARPGSVTYDLMKPFFWQYYRQVVFRETKIWIKANEVEKETTELLKNFLYWMIGDSKGKYDPNKSLYIWGEKGVGKSTIAEAGHIFMSYLKDRTKWKSRYFGFVSMDELFLSTYTTSSLAGIGALSKGSWCMDELKEKHTKYKHFGNDFYILADILLVRHNLWKKDGTNTIITSNIPPSKLNSVLEDERLFDRIRQQYETVELTGTNKRKIKK